MTTYGLWLDLTITTASIADGNGRKSQYEAINTDEWQLIHWSVELVSGATPPTAGTLIEIYAFLGDGGSPEYFTDGESGGDVALSATPENAELIGTIVVTATAAKTFYKEGTFQVRGMDNISIGFMNETGQTLSTVEGDGILRWRGEKA